jgi:hypothetical protein
MNPAEAAKARLRLGAGGRFKRLTGELEKKGATDPAVLAAWIGRRKYGPKKFAKLAARGRQRDKE